MLKQHKTKLAAIIALLVLTLIFAGCGTSLFMVDVSDDGKSMDISLENTDEGDSASSGNLIIEEGEVLTVEPAFEGDNAVTIKLIPGTEAATDPELSEEEIEGLVDPEKAVLDETISGTEPVEFELPAGEYYVYVITEESSTGEAHLAVTGGKDAAKSEGQEDGQNPIMNYVGPYVCDRAVIMIEADGDSGARMTVDWASSATENTEWTMTGTFDQDTRTIEYHDCTKTDYVYDNDGKVKSEEEVFVGGHGFMTFSEGDKITLTWQEDQEHIADDMTFEFNADAGR